MPSLLLITAITISFTCGAAFILLLRRRQLADAGHDQPELDLSEIKECIDQLENRLTSESKSRHLENQRDIRRLRTKLDLIICLVGNLDMEQLDDANVSQPLLDLTEQCLSLSD